MQRGRVSLGLLTLMFCVSTVAMAQDAASQKKTKTASIAGRVKLGDKPLPRAMVGVYPAAGNFSQLLYWANADEDGQYRLTNVPANRYRISATYPGYVSTNETFNIYTGTLITVEEGETIENIDFTLRRGGVISGRITDASGRPLVNMRVNLTRVDEKGIGAMSFDSSYAEMFMTDDRGVYRVYGIPAGRYRVFIGNQGGGTMRVPMHSDYYTLTYYPGVTDQAKAETLEVTEGGELDRVDFSLNLAEKTYSATGRIIDAGTGRPLAGIIAGYGRIVPAGERQNLSYRAMADLASNANGEFKIAGITPGQYAAYIQHRSPATDGEIRYFATPVTFEIKDEDVSGLEIKASPGASVSGFVEFEGEDSARLLQQFSPLSIMLYPRPQQNRTGIGIIPAPISQIRVAADGSFTIPNVAPGTFQFNGYSNRTQGVRHMRTERDGVEQRDGIEVKSGEQVTGVRVVLALGAGIVRGSIKLENGTLTESFRVYVSLRAVGKPPGPNTSSGTQADALGRFWFEGLLPGEYEVEANLMLAPGTLPSSRPPSMPRVRPVKQTVRVSNDAETKVTLVLDLNPSANNR